MSHPPVTDLSAGASLTVPLPEIEATLAALWPTAAQLDEQGGEPAVTRVSLGTIVAVTDPFHDLPEFWGQLARQHPSRGIHVVLDPVHDATVEAAISAACHLPAPGRPQVCSELVRLTTGPAGLERLPGAILPLLEADLPATLVWAVADPPPLELVGRLAREVDRWLTELTFARAPGALWQALRRGGARRHADLAWYRAGRWREGIARLFDGLHDPAALAAIERLDVTVAAGNPAEQFPGALLAGWVAGQLGWTPHRRADTDRSPVGGEVDRVVRSWWRTPRGAGEIRLNVSAPVSGQAGRLRALGLQAPSQRASWLLERLADRPRELRVEAHHEAWCIIPTTLAAPRPEPCEVLSQALTTPPVNPVRERSLAHAAWLLGWAD